MKEASKYQVIFMASIFFLVACGDDSDSKGNNDSGVDAQNDATSLYDAANTDDRCKNGPLSEPLADCMPSSAVASDDLLQDCVDRINQLRWECQCLPPLQRWAEGEACAAEHAEYDITHGAHAGFGDEICSSGGRAQNECPGRATNSAVIDSCLQQMWNEGPGEPYAQHGHYINMTNEAYTKVACGFADGGDSGIWSVQNFN
ncbi:MAG: hypothetical protein IPJ88_04425 [Myxococcales bacterium]|nr:MAG: hypothetical protein IPJ88_04425 [Myxococcales bacterium]